MINISNLHFSYDEKQKIFENINLIINENCFTAIIGENGCGKSTLAKLIANILSPDKGTITIDGLNTQQSKHFLEIRKKCALIMPNPEWQLIGSTVEEEISAGLYNLNYYELEIKKKVMEISEKLCITHLLNKSTEELSGGEKQIVNLASVLILEPKYLILDEPISMLDKYNQKIVVNFLKLLKQFNISIIFITHSMKELLITDCIIGIKNGKITHNKISVNDFINKDIYKKYDFNLNFELTLKKEVARLKSS